MNVLEMNNITAIPGRADSKVFLNGEDVTNDTYKVEINVTEILLHRIERPSRITEDGDAARYATKIDEIKVNA